MSTPGVPARPGKIIAVHVAYESRAAQRGKRPAQPSYFLKAGSSVAATGETIERPAGTSLLAFEGEIAVVIGATARRVTEAEAWSHVAGVTASNDFGLYDMKAADKGSNVRSKSRDGFTPLGPELIPAAEAGPDSLRIRTWVNGEVAQDDGTSARQLIFSLPRIIADLSQHLSLEPDDVILTGTPAGSSVVAPGDTVEVEVTATSAQTGARLSSGRLTTTVVEGPGDFDAELGSLPAIDESLTVDAWGSREAAGLAPEPGSASASALDEGLVAKLTEAPTAGLSAQLRARGLNNVVIEGVAPLEPGSKIVGTAKTLRFVPNREDLFKSHGGGYNAQKRAFDSIRTGEVVVIEARGESGSGTLGDILALRAKSQGSTGVITDGGVRDSAEVAGILPVFATAKNPAVLGRRHVPWESDVAVACGNATVLPGDVIVADDDGAIVIPRDLVEEVVDAALAKETEDGWVAEQVAAGHPIEGLFPPKGEWKTKFEDWKASQ